MHPLNIYDIFSAEFVPKWEMSKDFKDLQFENMFEKSLTFSVLKFEIYNFSKDMQLLNIYDILSTFSVFNEFILID
jgi:hypothetical protein